MKALGPLVPGMNLLHPPIKESSKQGDFNANRLMPHGIKEESKEEVGTLVNIIGN